MIVNPGGGPDRVSGPDPKRTGRTAPAAPAGKAPHRGPGDPPPADEVQISDAARELLGSSSDEAAPGSLDSGRLRQILDRLANGTYDRPATRAQVLLRLAREMGLV